MKRNRTVAVLLICVFAVASCQSKEPAPVVRIDNSVNQGVTPTQGTTPQGIAPNGAAAPVVPAPVVTQASWTPDALEELLAPVALYPDQLLGQVLAASINSQEVLDGGNWLLQNQNITGNDLDAAAEKAGFGPAMRALMQFPTVVDMMCQEIDWTRQLGSAVTSDQKAVLDAVQRLRKDAADVGNLKSTPQQTVSTKTDSGNVYIEVKPADPQIIYVPQYDAQAVYNTPPPQAAPAAAAPAPAATTTTTTTTEEKKEKDGVSTGTAVAIGLIGFAAGIAIGNSMHDDYYYPHWGYGMYYGPRPFYPPAYAYRPVYGPAFRPAYGYRPPVNYRNSYNNVRVNNINVNNNKNYYNRFNNNQNLRTGNTRSPIASTQPRVGANQPRANQGARPATNQNWKGQSSYAGARDARTGNSAAARPNANTREAQTSNRAATAAPRVDRGYGDAGRVANPDTARAANRQVNASPDAARAGNRQANTTPDPVRAADRQVNTPPAATNRPATPNADIARPATRDVNTSAAARPTPSTTPRAEPARQSAFSGGQSKGSGSFERSASARGNASVGSRQVSGGRARR